MCNEVCGRVLPCDVCYSDYTGDNRCNSSTCTSMVWKSSDSGVMDIEELLLGINLLLWLNHLEEN